MERPELEEQKSKLVEEVNHNKKLLKGLEDDLLYRLANSTGNLLDDTSLIEVLQITKTTAAEVKEKLQNAAEANERISGLTLWHFFDFKVNDAAENHTACQYAPGVFPPTCTSITLSFRPGGENHKGVVDFWRRPKPAYAQVAARYNASRLRAQGQVYGQPVVQV